MSTEINIDKVNYLYRIIPFYELVQMCEKPRKIILRSPRLWEDNYEGYFYRKLLTQEGLQKAYDYLIKIYPQIPDITFNFGEGKKLYGNSRTKKQKVVSCLARAIINSYLFFAISCFGTSEESDAMWRIYSFDKKSLRIKIDWKKLEQQTQNERSKLYLLNIDYNDFSFENDLEKVFKAQKDDLLTYLNIPFTLKRKAFKHEKEIRIMYNHKLEQIPLVNIPKHEKHSDQDINDFLQKIHQACKSDNFDNNLFLISIKQYLSKIEQEYTCVIELNKYNLESKDFIKEILVHPQAPDFYVDIVKKYCERHDLKFVGKSHLYTME